MLVTGASSGIGAAVSSLLADRGARVVGTGRDGAELARVSMAGNGPFEATVARDLMEPAAPTAVVEEAAAASDGLDVVVSNAGAGWLGFFEQMPSAEIDALLDINLRAPMHLAHAASPYLRKSVAGGQLVLVGSIAGLVGVAEEVAYGAAKAGLRGLADGLRAEWATRPGDGDPRQPRSRRHALLPPPEPALFSFVAPAHPGRHRRSRHRAGHRNPPGGRGHPGVAGAGGPSPRWLAVAVPGAGRPA